MAFAILADVLRDWSKFELDDSIYVTCGAELSVDVQVNVLPFDCGRKRIFEGQSYLLGIEQVRDVVTGLEKQLGRTASTLERLKAVLHFAKHDVFIAPTDL